MLQTIGNKKFGGVIDGLILSYHEPVSVNNPPIKATTATITKHAIRTPHLTYLLAIII